MPLVSEPSAEAQQVNQLFRWFRGGTLAAFSQVEFGMGRIMSRLQSRPELATPLKRAPYNAEARAAAFRDIFSGNEPLRRWLPEVERIVSNFEKLITLRSFLAHGFARIDMGSRTVQLRKFQPISGDEWNEASLDLRFEELETIGPQVDAFSQFAVSTFIEISKEFKLDF